MGLFTIPMTLTRNYLIAQPILCDWSYFLLHTPSLVLWKIEVKTEKPYGPPKSFLARRSVEKNMILLNFRKYRLSRFLLWRV